MGVGVTRAQLCMERPGVERENHQDQRGCETSVLGSSRTAHGTPGSPMRETASQEREEPEVRRAMSGLHWARGRMGTCGRWGTCAEVCHILSGKGCLCAKVRVAGRIRVPVGIGCGGPLSEVSEVRVGRSQPPVTESQNVMDWKGP